MAKAVFSRPLFVAYRPRGRRQRPANRARGNDMADEKTVQTVTLPPEPATATKPTTQQLKDGGLSEAEMKAAERFGLTGDEKPDAGADGSASGEKPGDPPGVPAVR